ncbi:MAG: armadillo-type protein [Lentinula lateritia]|nr:MAG: armadillo-type protein [Lentinula lateritia]
MGVTALTASSIPTVSRLLNELLETLHNIRSPGYSLNQATIKYVFFPIYALLNRNDSTGIPDQVVEKVFAIFNTLCEDWCWYLELKDWDQLFMLCGSIIGGFGAKGEGKERAEETKETAAHCLLSLLRQRDNDDGPLTPNQIRSRMRMFVEHVQTPFIPILGQSVNSVLLATEHPSLSMQLSMLELLFIMLSRYFPDDLIVSVLPGVVSTTCRICLGAPGNKGWLKGAAVGNSLRVMQEVISKSIGDEPCIKAGVVLSVATIEELADLVGEQPPEQSAQEESKYGTSCTSSWLKVTSSQLLIAMKSLSPLIQHPTSSALPMGLAEFSVHVLRTTPTTLPQIQPLLLSYLLALTNSELPSVSEKATELLSELLTASSKARCSLTWTLMRMTRDNLIALPVLLPSQSDTKVEHVTGIIEAICRLALIEKDNTNSNLSPIAFEIGKLLGPTGCVEKWGWSLLSVLELVDPPVTVTSTSAAQMMLENECEVSAWLPFPQSMLKNVSSMNTFDSLVQMFHALGKAAGDAGVFAVHFKAVTGMWCACRLLEGISNVSLSEDPSTSLSKNTAQLWDSIHEDDPIDTPSEGISDGQDEVPNLIQHVGGLIRLHDTLQITPGTPIGPCMITQSLLQSALSVQLISITAGILETRFSPLFIYSLYPILHSLVSPFFFLAETGLRALTFVTVCTSYASPANLLLSNFDYVLDSVSRRLSRQWLDVDATKVLVVMIRLVGSDIVERAGDVVEECFDRFDEYHGYEIVVGGLVEVLGEVMKIIKFEELSKLSNDQTPPVPQSYIDQKEFDSFFEWFAHRSESTVEEDQEDYGPAPRNGWGDDNPPDKANTGDQPEDVPEALTKQIFQRSIYFLTHESTGIRARILDLLSSSIAVLSESTLMSSIHSAWPFVLNGLADTEVFVVSAAAGLVEALVTSMGSLMFRRVWDDVWPRFRSMLSKVETADEINAVLHRIRGSVGTESVYTHSHQLYCSIINTMTAALKGVDPQDSSNWEVIVAFRSFLHSETAEELQQCVQELYLAAGTVNADAVWLALPATSGQVTSTSTKFFYESQWDIVINVELILGELDTWIWVTLLGGVKPS